MYYALPNLLRHFPKSHALCEHCRSLDWSRVQHTCEWPLIYLAGILKLSVPFNVKENSDINTSYLYCAVSDTDWTMYIIITLFVTLLAFPKTEKVQVLKFWDKLKLIQRKTKHMNISVILRSTLQYWSIITYETA